MKNTLWIGGLTLLLCVTVLISLTLGKYPVGLAELGDYLRSLGGVGSLDEMRDTPYPGIEAINLMLESARVKLANVYFHNFVGSRWVNTLCPSCGSLVIERFSLGCGGDKLQRFLCRDGTCPACGRAIRLLGGRMAWNDRREAA